MFNNNFVGVIFLSSEGTVERISDFLALSLDDILLQYH